MGPTMQFHVLSFEGPDPYARAGGLAARVVGLTEGLAEHGIETHLWFIGDPALPGHETRDGVRLHRWCQWISRYHPGGVYDGEEGKRRDYAASLPPYLVLDVLRPHLAAGGRATVLAEDWQTVDAVLHLDWLLRRENLRGRVTLLWNANNTFGFDRIAWPALARAAVITTVSRYMRQFIQARGADGLVIANGLPPVAYRRPPAGAVTEFRRRLHGRTVVTKIARWDPDKRWTGAVAIVGEMKRQGWRPLLIARGGVEEHGAEVLTAAAAEGLRIVERATPTGRAGLLGALGSLDEADVLVLRSPLDPDSRGVLYRGAGAVLANSSHEPFGLVALEAMAAGGLACTGCSGEDYAVPGRNALVVQTGDPEEFLGLFHRVRANPAEDRAIRRAGRVTAADYAWRTILERVLLPRLALLQGRTDAGRVPVALRRLA
jgi:glycosyltransferase involved in cell wall biosynthesis